ncbi:hypothetical protein [Nocardioides sp. 503]|uniref:hypothetical protein n=1 Tax=Nocardioides sp. 503 TaxID=2508326 RepID=UPI00106F62D4|nr:hypothetical protein [Nocardioides sp. 503]
MRHSYQNGRFSSSTFAARRRRAPHCPWLRVGPQVLGPEAELRVWVERGVAAARVQPPKG